MTVLLRLPAAVSRNSCVASLCVGCAGRAPTSAPPHALAAWRARWSLPSVTASSFAPARLRLRRVRAGATCGRSSRGISRVLGAKLSSSHPRVAARYTLISVRAVSSGGGAGRRAGRRACNLIGYRIAARLVTEHKGGHTTGPAIAELHSTTAPTAGRRHATETARWLCGGRCRTHSDGLGSVSQSRRPGSHCS